ncbi:DUF6368 family protein [Nonomuraea basaltis]|uniref:DUF6368 family protein n=1 Tax=Nonomuraea basaltis TaxID=2495887 RepID=UPI00110C4451|nr:DUF6368 family protein [Nonomuraea basaltis]TMR89056.1 hypothetical protein EJK15_62820 [Nonomuraea basaltis]
MAGPVASVLLPAALTGADAAAFDRWLNEVFAPHDGGWFLRAPAAIGAPDSATDAGRFLIDRAPWPDYEGFEEDFPGFAESIGYRPGEQIEVCAMVNRPVDHLVLGRVCLALARDHAALVDFGGALDAVGQPQGIDYLTEDPGKIERTIAGLDAAVGGLEGRVWSMRYETARGTPWITHVGDAEFLASWLSHPRFRMIK